MLTSYSATVPGTAVAAMIPSASADADFDATFTVTDDDELAKAVLTGPFYPDADDVTYTDHVRRLRDEAEHHRTMQGPRRRGGQPAAAGPRRRGGGVRGGRHLRRGARPAGHDDHVGLAVDELQRAAPIVSGFLLGYVAVLPLIGRIADLRGRVPVLVGSLVVFALGSLVTAAAYDLPSMVIGRFLQGVGGGGLVPATLALVADLYPPARRGVPLGVVGAVQELGSVLGPLYGALVLAVAAVAGDLRDQPRRRPGPRRRPPLPRRPVTHAAGDRRVGAGDGSARLARRAPAARDAHRPRPDDGAAAGAHLAASRSGSRSCPLIGESRWLAPVGLATVAARGRVRASAA